MVKVNGKDVEWVDPPEGGYLTDVKVHVLWQDDATGAQFRLAKVPKGGAWELPHIHPNAGQLTFLLSGELQRPDGTRQTFGKGDYGFDYTPKGQAHGLPKGSPVKLTKDVIALQYYDGPLERVNIEE